MPLILLTNDDGVDAEGLRRLEQGLSSVADVLVVAPDRERSGVSHGLTISTPLALNKLGPNRYALNGTPADCIIYAFDHVIIATPPDLIISGINHGANLGDDVMYSGTVAAAREGARRGITALAVSQAFDERPVQFDSGVKFIGGFVEQLLRENLNPVACLNVNIPEGRIKGVKITRLDTRSHFLPFNAAGRKLREPTEAAVADRRHAEIPLDFETVIDHYVSITPLQRDQTDYEGVQALLSDAKRLF